MIVCLEDSPRAMCAIAPTAPPLEPKLLLRYLSKQNPQLPSSVMQFVAEPVRERKSHVSLLEPSTRLDDDIGDRVDEQSFDALCAAFRSSGGVAWEEDLSRMLQDRHPDTSTSLARLIASNEVFSFGWRGTRWIPMLQFELGDLSLRSTVFQVRSELDKELDEWGVALWFARRNAFLGDRRPADSLESDLPAVLQAARVDRFVSVW